MKALLAGAILAGLAGAASAQEVVRLGTEAAYPPFNFLNDAGEIDGFERELGEELCARVGVTCTFVANDWDTIIPNLLAGNYDAIVAGMNITDERDAIIDFTQAYTPPAAAAYAALSPDADIAGGLVAAQAGTIHASHVAASGATLLEFATPDETIAAVRSGQADAVFAVRDYLVPAVEASGSELVLVGEPVTLGRGVGMGFREADDALRARFDAAIGAMKADGSLNALIAKWFGADAETF